jgi:perosamine synthetase
MVLTDRKEYHERLKLVSSHGRLDKVPYFNSSVSPDYIDLGYNWRISSMTAALGISQMGKLERAIGQRRKVAAKLNSRLGRIEGIDVPTEPKGSKHTYQMYTIRVKEGRRTRNALNSFLSSKGINSKVYFEPVHRTRFYRELLGSRLPRLPVTEWASSRVLTIPVYPSMTDAEVNYTADCIEGFFARR